eukprot:4171013-Pyramimonas_sp.AAC.1
MQASESQAPRRRIGRKRYLADVHWKRGEDKRGPPSFPCGAPTNDDDGDNDDDDGEDGERESEEDEARGLKGGRVDDP